MREYLRSLSPRPIDLGEERVCYAPAGAAGGEEEPVHEDAGAVLVGVVGEEAVPLVLLLALAVAGAAQGPGVAGKKSSKLLGPLKICRQSTISSSKEKFPGTNRIIS